MREVLWLECDYDAEWPTWVTSPGEPPGSIRTAHRPLDDLPVTDALRALLFAWQQRWEALAEPADAQHDIDPEKWADFVSEGKDLAAVLQVEIGDRFEVRCRFTPDLSN